MPTIDISKETHGLLTNYIDKIGGKIGRYSDKAILRQIHQDTNTHDWTESNTSFAGAPGQIKSRFCRTCGRSEVYAGKIKEWIFSGFANEI